MHKNNFAYRHNGPNATEIDKMLEDIGVSSLDEILENYSS